MIQNPGVLPGVPLHTLGSLEIEIANNLSTFWFVAFASVKNTGNSRFPWLILKPCDKFKERFNLIHDILCVFHPYPVIDSRLIDSINEILNSQGSRLDRLCIVLITNAERLSINIADNSDSDPRIIIPFKYQELRGGVAGKENLMIENFERLLFTKDLFSMSSALKTEKYFFGRAADIQRLVGHYQNNENSSVFGLRRIGKTSVLWAIIRHLKSINAYGVIIDGNDTRYHKASWNKALYRIKEILYTSSGIDSRTGKQEGDYTEADAAACFTDDLKFLKQRSGRPSLIIFDEIQNLCFDISSTISWSDGTASLPFWQTIRSVYQQNQNLFSFILAGTNPHIVEKAHTPSGLDNPLFNYVASYYLGFFDYDNVKSMITQIGLHMGASFDSAIFTYLTDDFGGHPFLIRQACSHLWRTQSSPNVPRRITTSKFFYQSCKSGLFDYTRNYIAMILEVLTDRYPREYELLRILAAQDHVKFNVFAEQNPQDIQHLVGYGLIAKENDKYYFRIAAVEMAVRENARDLICPSSIEERWAIISKERNQFEYRFREFVRSNLKSSVGKIEAKRMAISVMQKRSQINKANDQDVDTIFSGEFYFSNLRDLVIQQWERFKFLFDDDKQKFTNAMTEANKLRADAHASTITEDQFKSVMPQLVWLSNSFNENS
ncbi:MAG: AAA-like domain-containing protein [Giesbergeria sp.]|uniref:AAA-like domain-containing protein n=1 Tax=Giesbergeria sp. TaxID=2818473 RepID=UPI00262D800E|nr:AAA-like domain-containing protein [Giesbergeria sp.]MDD2608474.1 AAA-like domain-containing protein [Giesbergeria sp.]